MQKKKKNHYDLGVNGTKVLKGSNRENGQNEILDVFTHEIPPGTNIIPDLKTELGYIGDMFIVRSPNDPQIVCLAVESFSGSKNKVVIHLLPDGNKYIAANFLGYREVLREIWRGVCIKERANEGVRKWRIIDQGAWNVFLTKNLVDKKIPKSLLSEELFLEIISNTARLALPVSA